MGRDPQAEAFLLGLSGSALRQAQEAADPDERAYHDGAADVLLSAAGGMDPGAAIERQEAAGQKQLVHSDLLPVDAPWEKLTALGFVRGEDRDSVLCEATLPPGWEKRATDHSMHSEIVDEKGRTRAGVFYKAAFYDRSANLHLTRRFSCGSRPVGGWGNPDYDLNTTPHEGYVQDCGRDIFVSEEKAVPPRGREDRQAVLAHIRHKELLGAAAAAWLKERYPNCDDPLAYWE